VTRWDGILDVLAAADVRSVNAYARYCWSTDWRPSWELFHLHRAIVDLDIGRHPDRTQFEATV
jgi:hypothetical protein